MMLEVGVHDASCFVTLTFKDDPGLLDPEVFQLFLKRLRYYRGPFRFYGVGEYGSVNGRAHWHAGLFGVSMAEQDVIAKAWRGHLAAITRKIPEASFGGVHVGELNHASAMYLCKYMCKGARSDTVVRMSRNPGIGAVAVRSSDREFISRGGCAAVASVGDVPSELRVDGRKYPLGRYLRVELRKSLGWDGKAPPEVRRRLAFERSQETPDEIRLRSRKREAGAINLARRLQIKESSKL